MIKYWEVWNLFFAISLYEKEKNINKKSNTLVNSTLFQIAFDLGIKIYLAVYYVKFVCFQIPKAQDYYFSSIRNYASLDKDLDIIVLDLF